MKFDVEKIRNDFPVLHRKVYDKPFVYLDNAATTQKPVQVIEEIERVYKTINSNIHRGVHHLSDLCTGEYENAREKVASFINANHSHEVIFTSGTTGSVNLVAFSFGESFVGEGDEIIVSAMEHHSNIVPWQMLCKRKNAVLKVIPINGDGELIMEEYEKLIGPKTRLVAVVHVSNAIGTRNPVERIIEIAHKQDVPVLVDGAQSVQHEKIDVQKIDADFFAFSGHKIYGPTGTGVLYGKEKWLDRMVPWQGGGEMISNVTFQKTTYNKLPFKFEAGTPNYTGAIAMAAALDYVGKTGLENIAGYEKELTEYAVSKLMQIDGLRLIGTPRKRTSVISFMIENIHPYDAGMVIDKMGVAVRTGSHCAEPVMDFFGVRGTIRASLVFYNTKREIDTLYDAVIKVKEMFN